MADPINPTVALKQIIIGHINRFGSRSEHFQDKFFDRP